MDYWRQKYLLPAISSERSIALIGIGDNPDYWKSPDLGLLAQCWDPARLAVGTTNYCVYDINNDLVRKAADLGITSARLDLTSTPLPRPYDFIFASDVIEHVSNPRAFVYNLCASLTDGGRCILTTPNALYWRNFVAGFRHEHPEHCCSFGAAHLRNLSAMAGAGIVEIKSFQAVGDLSLWGRLLLPLHLVFASFGRGNSLVACLQKK